MITYVDEKSSARYTKLFKDASEALKLQNEITTIGGYLDHLNDLLKLDPKWVRLPVDEEVFKIDANSRKINVPKEFASNGVGIVGDELAEIVWFKIDRYFDIVDLGANPMKIYIQWETPAGDKGISAAYAISKEKIENGDIQEDYIYFGWALTSELTKKAGTIKFNVRIVKVEDGTDSTGATKKYIAYSFNTQPASVSIKQGINYDFVNNTIDIEDATELIGSRILQGNTAHSPIIRTNLSSIAFSGQTLSIVAEAIKHTQAEGGPDHTDDQNPILTYQWYYKPFGDSEYKMVVGTAEDSTLGATPSLKVKESGKYYCVVTASYRVVDRKVRDTEGHDLDIAYHSSLATSETVVCEVPEPIKLSIICEDGKQPLPEKCIIGDEVFGKEWSIEMGDQKANINGKEVSISELSCKVLKTAEGAILSDEALKDEANFIPADAKIVDVTITPNEPVTIEGKDEPLISSQRTIVVKPKLNAENVINPEGYYKLIISNTVNGSTIASDPTNICRVTKPVQAATPTGIIKQGSKRTARSFVMGDTLVPRYTLNGTVDEHKVLWYLQSAEKDPDSPAEDNPYPDTLLETTDEELVTTERGTYYFKVQTTLNGQTIISASSDAVSVN